MLQIKLNRFLTRAYISDSVLQALKSSTRSIDSKKIDTRLLTTVTYAYRHFWKSIANYGYWWVRISDLAEAIGCDEDTLYDSCAYLEDEGYISIEQHGSYFWFFLDNEKVMSDTVKQDLARAKETAKNNQ